MTDDLQLTPPEPALIAPEPVKPVAPAAAVGKVPVTPEQKMALQAQVDQVAKTLVSLPVDGPEFKHAVDSLSSMASKEIVASANVANSLLDRPARTMSSGAFGNESDVSKQMLDLRRTIEKLDPSRQGDLFSPKKLLGFMPFGNKVQTYFRGYESSQGHLNAIIEALYRSRDQLMRDNASIEQEKVNMWKLMGTLEQYAYLAAHVADAVEAQIASIEVSDPERARILKEDVLFYARQKQQDIATQMAVNIQGYMALDLVKKNNAELQKGIERATTTTVSALRTAVVVAQAIASQRLVLDQIQALNTTTGNLIAGNARMLKDNATRVYSQASSATVDVEKLKLAFANVMQAMDDMSNFKVKAIGSMQLTVTSLTGEVDKAKAYLAKQQRSGTQAATLTGAATAVLPPPSESGVARII
ncbi:MAG: toxic anion resistance protein [Candidatus Eremiobacteraeota bacterium]|nr:toxic anion resistance protein [Candidatus Eremiobacteraeota bacterium]